MMETMYRWHPPSEIKAEPFGTLHFNEVNTGCGLMTVSGFDSIQLGLTDKGKLVENFLKQCEVHKDRVSGVGAIMATLGDNYIYFESLLLEMGFEKVSSYPNLRHEQPYFQHLYLKKL